MVENTTYRKDFDTARNSSFKVKHLETKTLKRDLVEALIVLNIRQQEQAEKEQKLSQAQSLRERFKASKFSVVEDMTIQHLDIADITGGSGGLFEAGLAMVDNLGGTVGLDADDLVTIMAEMRDQNTKRTAQMKPHIRAELHQAGIHMDSAAGISEGMTALKERLEEVNTASNMGIKTLSVDEKGIQIPSGVKDHMKLNKQKMGYKSVSPRAASGIGVA